MLFHSNKVDHWTTWRSRGSPSPHLAKNPCITLQSPSTSALPHLQIQLTTDRGQKISHISEPVQIKPIVQGSAVIASLLLGEEKLLFTFSLHVIWILSRKSLTNIKNTFLCNTVVLDWELHITNHWENSKMQILTSTPTPTTRIKCIFKTMKRWFQKLFQPTSSPLSLRTTTKGQSFKLCASTILIKSY